LTPDRKTQGDPVPLQKELVFTHIEESDWSRRRGY